MMASVKFQHRLYQKDFSFSKGGLSKDSFLLYHTLTPDRKEQGLCPILVTNVRFPLTFKQDINKAVTMMFMPETTCVWEIKQRRIRIAY